MLTHNLNLTISVNLTVSFHDTDAMGVVWHGNYYRYLEIAREALFKQINYGYHAMIASGYVWPIIDTRLKYIRPLTFEQTITIQARMIEFENRVKINYDIFDSETGERTTTGYTIQVAVEQKSKEMCFVSPPILWQKLGIKTC